MPWNRKQIRVLFALVAFGVLLFVGLQNLGTVWGFVQILIGLLMPFIIGLCIAFILSVPMRAVETHLFRPLDKKCGRIWRKIRRPLAATVTLLLALGVLAAAVFLIIPELGRSLRTLADSIPGFIARAQAWLTELAQKYPQWQDWINDLQLDWNAIAQKLLAFAQSGAVDLFNSTVSLATSIFSGVFNLFLGVIFAMYVLMQKETLARQITNVLRAHLPDAKTDRLLEIGRLSNRTFSRFLTGQCLEAVILGLMFFVTMCIFRFPYALMIAVLIAVLALIPIFGAIIGCVVGAFLIFVGDPMQAFWFVVMFLILQQIEGNFIYPKVVGTSVGLPSIWVLAAVTVGGGVMGIFGMLVAVPLSSVLYSLLRDSTNRRLARRGIPVPDGDPPSADDTP
ncbi:AI-2E family transporter [Clostridia bacterium]